VCPCSRNVLDLTGSTVPTARSPCRQHRDRLRHHQRHRPALRRHDLALRRGGHPERDQLPDPARAHRGRRTIGVWAFASLRIEAAGSVRVIGDKPGAFLIGNDVRLEGTVDISGGVQACDPRRGLPNGVADGGAHLRGSRRRRGRPPRSGRRRRGQWQRRVRAVARPCPRPAGRARATARRRRRRWPGRRRAGTRPTAWPRSCRSRAARVARRRRGQRERRPGWRRRRRAADLGARSHRDHGRRRCGAREAAPGAARAPTRPATAGGGGGSGGGILLESARIKLDGILSANGGGGGGLGQRHRAARQRRPLRRQPRGRWRRHPARRQRRRARGRRGPAGQPDQSRPRRRRHGRLRRRRGAHLPARD